MIINSIHVNLKHDERLVVKSKCIYMGTEYSVGLIDITSIILSIILSLEFSKPDIGLTRNRMS